MHLDQLDFKISTDLVGDRLEPLESNRVEYRVPRLGHKGQMGVRLKSAAGAESRGNDSSN